MRPATLRTSKHAVQDVAGSKPVRIDGITAMTGVTQMLSQERAWPSASGHPWQSLMPMSALESDIATSMAVTLVPCATVPTANAATSAISNARTRVAMGQN